MAFGPFSLFRAALVAAATSAREDFVARGRRGDWYVVEAEMGTKASPFASDTHRYGVKLPMPEGLSRISRVRAGIRDEATGRRVTWPPVHLHHVECHDLTRPDPFFDDDVFHTTITVFGSSGARHLPTTAENWYELFDGGADHALAIYGDLVCGLRVDDDRKHDESSTPSRVTVVIEFLLTTEPKRLAVGEFWTFTRSGQVGYDVPGGAPSVVYSTDYVAPTGGRFLLAEATGAASGAGPGPIPQPFFTHTHGKGASLELFKNGEPMMMYNATIEAYTGDEFVKKDYVKRCAVTATPAGRAWAAASFSFEEGDIFTGRARYDGSRAWKGTMFLGSAHWAPASPAYEPPRREAPGKFFYDAHIRTARVKGFDTPSLMNRIPSSLTRASLEGLHEAMPHLFHPASCARRFPASIQAKSVKKLVVLQHVNAVRDLDPVTCD